MPFSFEKLDLNSSYFNKCKLKSVEFIDCKLDQCVFYKSDLTKTNLSTSTTTGATYEETRLKDCLVNLKTVIDFALYKGFVLKVE